MSPRTKIAAGAMLAILLIGWWQCYRPGSSRKVGRDAPSVTVSTVERRDVPVYVDGLGTVQAFNTVLVRARVDGQLEKLMFAEGQDVKAGDVLAVLDARPYQAVVDQALAKKAEDEARLADAELVLSRNRNLLARKVIDQQTFDTAKSAVDQLRATVQADQAAVDSARTQLEYAQIRSPIDGRTGIRLVDVGNVILADDPTGIVVITQLKPVTLVFSVSEKHLQPILAHRAAGEADRVLAVDADNPTPLAEGKLSVVDNQIDQATTTVKLKATFPNEDLKLWPGKFVTARLLLTTRRDATVVPSTALHRRAQGPCVYTVDRDGRTELRSVNVEHTQDDTAIIKEGVRPGEQVIVSGHDRVLPGMYVSVAGQSRPLANATPTPSPAAAVAAVTPTPTLAPRVESSPVIAVAAASPSPAPPATASPAPDAPAATATDMQGAFVIGDQNAVVGKKVYFWGRQWAKKNRLSKSAAPRGFAGYALIDGPAPECGKTWRSQSDAKVTPPDNLPPSFTAIVTSSARKSGRSTKGDIRKVAVIKLEGDSSARGRRAGVGTVVSVTCE